MRQITYPEITEIKTVQKTSNLNYVEELNFVLQFVIKKLMFNSRYLCSKNKNIGRSSLSKHPSTSSGLISGLEVYPAVRMTAGAIRWIAKGHYSNYRWCVSSQPAMAVTSSFSMATLTAKFSKSPGFSFRTMSLIFRNARPASRAVRLLPSTNG